MCGDGRGAPGPAAPAKESDLPMQPGRSAHVLARLVALLAAAGLAACGAPGTGGSTEVKAADVPEKPAKAVELNIIDVAGDLQLTQGMIDDFAGAHPDMAGKVTTSKAPAPELAGKIKAQQAGGQAQLNLVLTGTDGLSAGIKQNLWVKILPDFASRFPNLTANYLEPAAKMQELAQGYCVAVTYYPSGPLLEYNPAKVGTPPTTPQALLDWAKAHPGKFQYARPANSGPGRTFLMGLPYILGDADPKDPVNGWDKTWTFLKELHKYIDYYPSGTGDTMKNLGNGSVDMIASTTGWYINPRVLGTVPAAMKVTHYEGMHWVTDAHYACIPKGVSADVLAADLQLIAFMLQPKEQAQAYDKGYFYPGPAVRNVTIDMAPAASQQAIQQFGFPAFDQWIDAFPKETSLPADAQVAAFDKWDREVGSGKTK
jgi:putative spermidine/putrescine transport system substrate-binding protein